jgi:hypothetical protein
MSDIAYTKTGNQVDVFFSGGIPQINTFCPHHFYVHGRRGSGCQVLLKKLSEIHAFTGAKVFK